MAETKVIDGRTVPAWLEVRDGERMVGIADPGGLEPKSVEDVCALVEGSVPDDWSTWADGVASAVHRDGYQAEFVPFAWVLMGRDGPLSQFEDSLGRCRRCGDDGMSEFGPFGYVGCDADAQPLDGADEDSPLFGCPCCPKCGLTGLEEG
jgi:hypothetical protein